MWRVCYDSWLSPYLRFFFPLAALCNLSLSFYPSGYCVSCFVLVCCVCYFLGLLNLCRIFSPRRGKLSVIILSPLQYSPWLALCPQYCCEQFSSCHILFLWFAIVVCSSFHSICIGFLLPWIRISLPVIALFPLQLHRVLLRFYSVRLRDVI